MDGRKVMKDVSQGPSWVLELRRRVMEGDDALVLCDTVEERRILSQWGDRFHWALAHPDTETNRTLFKVLIFQRPCRLDKLSSA